MMETAKVKLAQHIVASSGFQGSLDEQITKIICVLRHLCDEHGVIYSGCEARAAGKYFRDLDEESTEPTGASQSLHYTGWDCIHDNNKAECRPIGGQWSD